MTNIEALASIILIPVELKLLEKILIDRNIDGEENYTSSNESIIELASAYVYKLLVTMPDTKQGSLSISNKQAENFKKLANEIFNKYGKTSELISAAKIRLQIL